MRRSLLASSGVHVLVIATLLVVPASWFSRPPDDALDVMSLRLGGPEGPGVGGRTALGGRPVQEVVTLPEARRPQWIQPPAPAPAPAAMVLPVPEEVARRPPEPEPEVPTVPEEARGRRLTTGPEEVLGSTMADTGVEGIGVGLSGGGLGGSGGELRLEDFCCPEYLATMLDLIQRRWDRHQRVTGTVIVRFEIGRSGRIDAVAVDRGSGYLALDLAAQRAVLATRQIPPLPQRYSDESLSVRLTFEYRP